MAPNTKLKDAKTRGSLSPLSSPLPPSTLEPLGTIKKAAQTSPQPQKRHKRRASNSEIPTKRSRIGGGSLLDDSLISKLIIPGAGVDIQAHIEKISRAIQYASGVAEEAHMDILRGLLLASPNYSNPMFYERSANTMIRELDRDMKRHAKIWTDKLQRLSEDFEDANLKLIERDRQRDCDHLLAGRGAAKREPKGDIKVKATTSEMKLNRIAE
ncbi:hypothetical protein HOY82DRAFT_534885 [Tuber indicum]|nr:hypothetical protein HOY82DRAFT_534885 [Tuber indicum]